jgi:hypothetical protein
MPLPAASPIPIFYPNGGTQAVQVYIWDGMEPILWDGLVTAVVSVGAVDQGSPGLTPWLVRGVKSNNAAAPTSDNIGALVAIANAAAPSWTEGQQVLLSTDLAGNVRVTGTIVVDTSLLATAAKQDTGNASLASIKTNTDTLVTVAGGGYVRQDSTATIAKETGGNLAAAATALQIIDDWDESDRAKVNIIVGVAGVSAGSGAIDTGTQRVALATDTTVPNVTGNVANDAADSGNPVKVGGKAITTFPTAVAASDRTDFNTDTYGRQFARTGREAPAGNIWTGINVASANAQATVTKASAGTGIRNVCTGFTVTLASSSTTAPAAIQIIINLIDGASGGTTYLFRSVIALPATAGAQTSIVRGNLWLPGTAATGMTLEFSAAGGANTIESVSMEGTVVTE